MERETNSRKETEAKTETKAESEMETGMKTDMEIASRVQELRSAVRVNSAVETAGTNNLSGRTGRVRAVAHVTRQGQKEMRGEAETAESKRRLGLLFTEREKRSPLFPLLW
jgi:hypothetical protein